MNFPTISPSFWLCAAILVPAGLASITSLNAATPASNSSVDQQFRGRVLALYLAFFQGGTAFGATLM
ncbi:hypothetical protein J2X01_002584 [Arthrobacter ginsengisoli]|uniref:MFS transporter n=1 Tax=Arthrobacter ginsengisoli TaxID=1356565 RepID=A0ABU1UDU9_9MICC|nr:hypothetical protein [Arthrobacter ginsengisoli]MDR7083290.1 hypothetical protein [Arthrobacter ginsengisoli]